ncbi:MAG: thermonuclease family protein [Mesorhizobium sp.]|nr:thermonuclease family protein [Mesorhizobium sp.]
MQLVGKGDAPVSNYLDKATSLLPRSDGNPIEGRASVVDGDTIEIAGQRVRFNGIDAPEGQQSCKNSNGKAYACGRSAAKALDNFLAGSRPVRCEFLDWDQYGRYVGNCARADGRSVQEWLVESGHALDWPRYSAGGYAVQQARAKQARRGVWQGEFEEPWEWRAAQRSEPVTPTVTTSPSFTFVGTSGCNIKGNVSNKGERIYHLPGQKFYEKTKISESKGERWFCSEAEARSAGWRKAQR